MSAVVVGAAEKDDLFAFLFVVQNTNMVAGATVATKKQL